MSDHNSYYDTYNKACNWRCHRPDGEFRPEKHLILLYNLMIVFCSYITVTSLKNNDNKKLRQVILRFALTLAVCAFLYVIAKYIEMLNTSFYFTQILFLCRFWQIIINVYRSMGFHNNNKCSNFFDRIAYFFGYTLGILFACGIIIYLGCIGLLLINEHKWTTNRNWIDLCLFAVILLVHVILICLVGCFDDKENENDKQENAQIGLNEIAVVKISNL